jgi:hypothetical protein
VVQSSGLIKKGHLELKSIIELHSHFDAPTYVFTKHNFVFANLWKLYVARNKSDFFLEHFRIKIEKNL